MSIRRRLCLQRMVFPVIRSVCLPLLCFLPAVALGQQLSVTRIVDGDTFELSDGRTVRLIGIDTPEKYRSSKLERDAERTDQDKATIRALGELASRHAAELAFEKRVELEFDQANAATGHQDRYGRTLAYVWVLGAGGQRRYCANERLVMDGYANAYTNYPFKYRDEYVQLQVDARTLELGLWDPELDLTLTDIGENGDRNCSDFSTHAEAQTYYLNAGGPVRDVHGLDGDEDGVACEGLAGRIRADRLAQPRGSTRCCRICRTGKACGDSCIARTKTCRKGPGCACDG